MVRPVVALAAMLQLVAAFSVCAQEEGSQYEKDIAAEDPLNKLPQGAQSVVGNEANPSMAIILDFGAAAFSTDNHNRQGGHALTTNGPAIQGAELAASASVDPFFRLDMAFELWHLHMEEIFATTTSLPLNFKVRAGKYLSAVGRHNPTHLHAWHFVSQPLANEYLFGAEGMSLPGVELSWLAPLPWYLEVIGGLQMGEAGSFKTDFSGDPGFGDFVYPLRLVQFWDLNDDNALQLGLNTVFGTSASAPEENNRTYAYGADLMYRWRPIGGGRTGYTNITWITEGWFRQMEVALSLFEDIGGYSDLIFGISKRWEIAVRGELWRRLGGATTSEEWNRDIFGMNTGRGNVSASFSPSHFSRIRLQYTYEQVGDYDPTHMAVLALEVSAGAHGAHAY